MKKTYLIDSEKEGRCFHHFCAKLEREREREMCLLCCVRESLFERRNGVERKKRVGDRTREHQGNWNANANVIMGM